MKRIINFDEIETKKEIFVITLNFHGFGQRKEFLSHTVQD